MRAGGCPALRSPPRLGDPHSPGGLVVVTFRSRLLSQPLDHRCPYDTGRTPGSQEEGSARLGTGHEGSVPPRRARRAVAPPRWAQDEDTGPGKRTRDARWGTHGTVRPSRPHGWGAGPLACVLRAGWRPAQVHPGLSCTGSRAVAQAPSSVTQRAEGPTGEAGRSVEDGEGPGGLQAWGQRRENEGKRNHKVTKDRQLCSQAAAPTAPRLKQGAKERTRPGEASATVHAACSAQGQLRPPRRHGPLGAPPLGVLGMLGQAAA